LNRFLHGYTRRDAELPREERPSLLQQRRAQVKRLRACNEFLVDLTLVMKGFDFETVWSERRDFMIDGTPVPTARLLHIIESKQAAGREKDQLFIATHLDALQQLLKKPDLG